MAPQDRQFERAIPADDPRGRIVRDPARDLAPFVPSATDPWDARKAAHLMRRAGFGAKPEEVEAMLGIGVERSVDLLLTVSTSGLQERGFVRLGNGEGVNVDFKRFGSQVQWLYEMVHTRHPLKEKLALFWSDHFSVGTKERLHESLMVRHVNLFRRHGLGRLRDMLIDVTRDPAMLWWLDNNVNGRPVNGRPKINENYARELLELYTMGVDGGYTQNDVLEVARCLTGWTTAAYDRFVYEPTWHVPGNKKVLGKVVYSNGEREVHDLIDTVVLPWPATARFLVTKIWEYFVSEDPYPELIEELASRFRRSGFDLRELMSTILRSSYFYGPGARHGLVKNPYEFVVGALRATDTTFRTYRSLDRRLVELGYPLMDYGDPSGFDDGLAWIDELTMLARANFANDLTRGLNNDFDPRREVVRAGLRTAEEIVDHYVEILTGGDVPAIVRTILIEFMNRVDSGREPFELTPAKVDQKVRGLVHVVLSSPQAQIN